MTQNITWHIKDMVTEAKSRINELSADEAIGLIGNKSTLIIDIRDIRERERDGFIEQSFHAPRGMLEFWIDPESPYHKPVFSQDKHFIFHCASGWRSALATDVAAKMGLNPVSHIIGGYTAWKEAGGKITTYETKQNEGK